MHLTVGITGASGAVYGYSLIRVLAELGVEVSAVLTDMGHRVLQYECGLTEAEIARYADVQDNHDLFSKLASGSMPSGGMVIVPCSMNTLGSVANGLGDNLLARTASVTLKEGRKLVCVTRETPLSILHIENMLRLARAGACIMPASPGFYSRPGEVWELVNGMTSRILDQFGLKMEGALRWNGGDGH